MKDNTYTKTKGLLRGIEHISNILLEYIPCMICFIIILSLSLFLFINITPPLFAHTQAGTTIRNQSRAIFDFEGSTYQVRSNLVTTNVAPVYNFHIKPDGDVQTPALTARVGSGSMVYFSYILTNTGNITDSYNLSIEFFDQNSDFDPLPVKSNFRANIGAGPSTNISIYLDINGNGVLDPGEANVIDHLSNIRPNQYVFLIVSFTVPSNVKFGNAFSNIIGESIGDPSIIDNDNVNKTIVTDDAALVPKKSASVSETIPDGIIEYTLRVENIGGASSAVPGVSLVIDGVTRNGVIITDEIPDKSTYITGSLSGDPKGHRRIFSTDNGQTWTEAATGAEDPSPLTITNLGYFIDGQLARGQSAKIVFSLQASSDYDYNTIENIAEILYRNNEGEIVDEATNRVIVNIIHPEEQPTISKGVFIGPFNRPEEGAIYLKDYYNPGILTYFSMEDLNGNGIVGDANDDKTIDMGVGQYNLSDGTQVSGNTVIFKNTLKNASGFVDSLNIIKDPLSSIPGNWPIEFFQSDGVTPIMDTDADGIIDTGPLPTNGQYTIVVKIQIPVDAQTGDNNGEGFSLILLISSATDPNIRNITTDNIPRVLWLGDFWDPFDKSRDCNDRVVPGEIITYSNTFGNKGPANVHNVKIRDYLYKYLVLVNVDAIQQGKVYNTNPDGDPNVFIEAIGFYDDTNHMIQWDIPEIPPGFVGELKFMAMVAYNTPNMEVIPNIFHILSDQTPADHVSNKVTNIVLLEERALEIVKTVNIDTVQIGDPLLYTIKATNLIHEAINDTEIIDTLPEGFRYEKGSAKMDGISFEPEVSEDGGTLTWHFEAFPAQTTIKLEYIVIVTSGAKYGIARNTARLVTLVDSLSDFAEVKVEKGPFVRESIIIGRVFVDKNFNRIHDVGEPGIKGVRLYMEDGTYVITDDEGKYHIVGVRAGFHVLRLDESTLPDGHKLGIIDGLNLCNPSSRLIDIKWGTIQKANFRVVPDKREKRIKSEKITLLPIEVNNDGELTNINIACDLPLRASYSIEPSSGTIIVDLPGVTESRQSLREKYNDFNLEEIRGFLDEDAGNARLHVRLKRRTSGYPPAQVELYDKGLRIMIGAGSKIRLDNDPHKPVLDPFEDTNSKMPQILSPEDGAQFVSRDKITVSVLCDITARYELYINDKPVDKGLIGKKSYQTKKRLAIYEYISVALDKGINIIRLSVTPPGAMSPISTQIKVYRSDIPVKMSVKTSPAPLVADGITEPLLIISLLDENGVPAGNGSVITIVPDKGDILSPDFRVAEPGHQAQIRDGSAMIRLTPAAQPETRGITLIDRETEYKTEVTFQPHLRKWIMTGIATGIIQDKAIKDEGSETGYDGSLGVFMKGKLPYDYLLTASYNSDYDNENGDFFNRHDPLEPYPVYGDETIQDYEAESRDNLYLKVEKDRGYLMYGDFNPDLDKTELMAYKRSFTGGKLHLESDILDMDFFAAYNDQAGVREEFPGDGTRGFYHLSNGNILRNSERVEIEIREEHDENHVIKSETKRRYTDYTIDYELGRILFKEPIYSQDMDHNPIYIVVYYEVEGFKDKDYYTSGGRVGFHNPNRTIELGITHIIDEGSPKDYRISGLDSTLELFRGVTLHTEYAETDSAEDGRDNAYIVELESLVDKAAFRAYWEDVGNRFNNPGQGGASEGRSEAGLKGTFRLTDKWSIENEIYTKKLKESSKIQTDVISQDFVYSEDDWGLRLGGGYIREKDESETDEKGFSGDKKTAFLRAGGNIKLTPKTKLEALHQYSTRNNSIEKPTSTEIDLTHQLTEKTSANISMRHQDNSEGSDDLDIIFGIDTQVTKSISAFERYTIEDGTNGESGRSNTGLELDYLIDPEWRIDASGELSRRIHGNNEKDDDFWALNLGFEYQPLGDEYTLIGDYGIRIADGEIKHLNELGGTVKLNLNHTLFARNIYTYKEDRTDGPDEWTLDALMGWAYRPIYNDKLNMISDLEIKHKEGGKDARLDNYNRIIYSLETHYQSSENTVWEIKYACKWAEADFSVKRYFTDLKAITWRHTFTEFEPCPGPESRNRCYPLIVSAGGRMLSDHATDTYSLGYGMELGIVLKKDFQVAVGYNFEGFEGDDYARGARWEKGPYVVINWKFDESIFGILARLKGTRGDKGD